MTPPAFIFVVVPRPSLVRVSPDSQWAGRPAVVSACCPYCSCCAGLQRAPPFGGGFPERRRDSCPVSRLLSPARLLLLLLPLRRHGGGQRNPPAAALPTPRSRRRRQPAPSTTGERTSKGMCKRTNIARRDICVPHAKPKRILRPLYVSGPGSLPRFWTRRFVPVPPSVPERGAGDCTDNRRIVSKKINTPT
jgi:hypothetical protein